MTDVHLNRHRAECERLGCAEFFDQLIEEGNNPGFAAMLAQRRPPGTKGTDRTFLEGSHHWADKKKAPLVMALGTISTPQGTVKFRKRLQ